MPLASSELKPNAIVHRRLLGACLELTVVRVDEDGGVLVRFPEGHQGWFRGSGLGLFHLPATCPEAHGSGDESEST